VNQHSLTHSLTKKTRLTIKRSTISIKLTVYTKDKAIGIAADNITSVEEATIAIITIAVAIIAIATIAWATVAITTIAAITIKEAIKKEAEENIKAFNKRNAIYITN
jgi:hypothetical protein